MNRLKPLGPLAPLTHEVSREDKARYKAQIKRYRLAQKNLYNKYKIQIREMQINLLIQGIINPQDYRNALLNLQEDYKIHQILKWLLLNGSDNYIQNYVYHLAKDLVVDAGLR